MSNYGMPTHQNANPYSVDVDAEDTVHEPQGEMMQIDMQGNSVVGNQNYLDPESEQHQPDPNCEQ